MPHSQQDSPPSTLPEPRLRPHYYWMLQLIGWGGYGAVGMAIQLMFYGMQWRNLALVLCNVIVLLLLTHGLRHIAKTRKWTSLSFGKLALRLLPATLLLSLISQLIASALLVWVFDLLGSQRFSFAILGIYIFQTQVILVCWSLIYFAFHAFRNRQIEQIEKWRLQAALKEAELSALKAQINPHFIFNCLNNIRALVLENPEKSREMITRLSDLLRYSIQFHQETLVPLEQEIAIVRDYLALESIHYEERLRYHFDINAHTLQLRVPPMSVQLLVENAIKHGIANLPNGGSITIQSSLLNGTLRVSVRNTGQLRQPSVRNSIVDTGIGLRNSQERLDLLFPSHCSLTVQNLNEETVEAAFTIAQYTEHSHESSDR